MDARPDTTAIDSRVRDAMQADTCAAPQKGAPMDGDTCDPDIADWFFGLWLPIWKTNLLKGSHDYNADEDA
ncbi:hypothetical protein PTE30175_01238 [Pandoraea terrae]|uniref:Uncharacterized protein n=1 Tax=Pandoraea terrae TaxID=1537710 RepID=A0A5E4T990_9BURK|nr:hypothetical protein [Pandoraea terrae]VVD84670.1 hypothetical protein PTE30175_01238 [Pandoraea terrae]